MRRPGQPALTDAGTGRVSMPFLPTLAVVAILGTASLYCSAPNSAPPASAGADRIEAAGAAAAPLPTDFARTAAIDPSPGRLPASLAFAEAYPLDGAPSKPLPAAPLPAAPLRAAASARPLPHLAAATRRACPGRRCPEAPQRAADPLAAGRAEASGPAEDQIVPRQALPFTDAVAESLTPALRAFGDAAGLMRAGAAAVQGSVVLAVADCLR